MLDLGDIVSAGGEDGLGVPNNMLNSVQEALDMEDPERVDVLNIIQQSVDGGEARVELLADLDLDEGEEGLLGDVVALVLDAADSLDEMDAILDGLDGVVGDDVLDDADEVADLGDDVLGAGLWVSLAAVVMMVVVLQDEG